MGYVVAKKKDTSTNSMEDAEVDFGIDVVLSRISYGVPDRC